MKRLFNILFFYILGISFVTAQWNTDRITLIGRNALANEDYVLAIQYFNQVIRVKPYLAEPYMYRAIAKICLEDFLGAEQDCNQSIQLNPFVPQTLYTRGYAKKKLSKYDEAINDFNRALEFSPENEVILLNRAEVKEQNKKYDEAIEDLQLYQKLFPKQKSVYYEIGRIKLEQNDTIAALTAFDDFVKADTLSPLGYSARALLRMITNDEDGALRDYDEAIKKKSKYSSDYINRGILNVKRNKFTTALSDYNEAIRLEPNNTLAYYNRGLLRANLGDNNNAISDLEKVLQTDSTNYEARLQKANLELTVGNLVVAEKEFNIILEKYPFFVPAYYGIAEAIEKQGRRNEANRLKSLALDMERNKDFYKKKQILTAKNQISKEIQKQNNTKESSLTEQFMTEMDAESRENKYGDGGIRGNIQDSPMSLDLEKDFMLTYYQDTTDLSRTNTYHPSIAKFNNTKSLPQTLKLSNNIIQLTPEVLNHHFESINSLSVEMPKDKQNGNIYFARALDFSFVQDYNSALDDINKAIALLPDFSLVYFTRANIRNSLILFNQSSVSNNLTSQSSEIANTPNQIKDNYTIDYERILEDLDKTIELDPDFSFAYFNKGNILFLLKRYNESIEAYSKAIEINPDFSEAYFNRGLTYIRTNDATNANKDISKAGELGVFQAYSILKRLHISPKE